MKGPDAKRSIERYRRLAQSYDASSAAGIAIREKTVALLNLQPGEVVVDMASGTGLSFASLLKAVGPNGRVVAIEHSPEMMVLARRRVQVAGWDNVSLIESAAQAADVPEFDAVLFHYAHDVLQSSAALARLFARAKPGARVAVAGAKFTSWMLAPLNLWVMIRARPYLSTYAGLRQPWRNLQTYVPDLMISPFLLDTGYIAHGRFRSGGE